MPTAYAILLAAGESTRMGQLKALLPWRGRPLIQHQTTALLDGGAKGVIAVLGHRANELKPLIEGRPNLTCALNPHYQQGKTTSIKAGLTALESLTANQPALDEILLLNVDQPRTPAIIAQILQSHSAARQPITVPQHHGKGGHPIILTANLIPELQQITEETQGLKALIRRHYQTINRPPIPTPEILLDLNTPEQYHAALAATKL